MFVSELMTTVFVWLLARETTVVMHVFATATFVHVVASMMVTVATRGTNGFAVRSCRTKWEVCIHVFSLKIIFEMKLKTELITRSIRADSQLVAVVNSRWTCSRFHVAKEAAELRAKFFHQNSKLSLD